MSATLSPASQLAFHRPLTRTITKTLSVTNPHESPIAFKVKTTAPKLYCVRPNSGRIEPGQTVEVSVILQAMRDEPPANVKCKDKFLVQTTLITGTRETKSLTELWTPAEDDDETHKIHQQKIKVVYLPLPGQSIPEDNSTTYEHPSIITSDGDLSRYETVRQSPLPSSTHPTAFEALRPVSRPVPVEEHIQSPSPPLDRPGSPGEYIIAQEETTTHETLYQPPPAPAVPVAVPESTPVARAPSPAPSPVVPAPAPSTTTVDDQLSAKYADALAEISRLQSLLVASQQTPAVPTGVRRRTTRVVSEDMDGSIAEESEDGTLVDSQISQPDGVPVQIVAAISLAVFLLTYLFF